MVKKGLQQSCWQFREIIILAVFCWVYDDHIPILIDSLAFVPIGLRFTIFYFNFLLEFFRLTLGLVFELFGFLVTVLVTVFVFENFS